LLFVPRRATQCVARVWLWLRARSAREPGCPSARPVQECRYRRHYCLGSRSAATRPARSAPCAESWMGVRGSAPLRRSLWRALRARLLERHGVTRYRFSRTEAAERRARCPQGEPSAMLPAVSAALAERSPEGHRGASKRSIQTPRSGRFKRLGAVNANVNEGVVGRVVRGPGRRRRTADRTGSRGPSRAEGRVHRARRGAPRRCDRGTNGHDRS